MTREQFELLNDIRKRLHETDEFFPVMRDELVTLLSRLGWTEEAEAVEQMPDYRAILQDNGDIQVQATGGANVGGVHGWLLADGKCRLKRWLKPG